MKKNKKMVYSEKLEKGKLNQKKFNKLYNVSLQTDCQMQPFPKEIDDKIFAYFDNNLKNNRKMATVISLPFKWSLLSGMIRAAAVFLLFGSFMLSFMKQQKTNVKYRFDNGGLLVDTSQNHFDTSFVVDYNIRF